MPLVPGTLPPSSCFGTPQETLDLFSRYLEVAGNISDVRYANTSAGIPVNDTIWVDTSLTPPRLKIYSLGEWREIVVGTNTVGSFQGLFASGISNTSVQARARKLGLFDAAGLGIIRTLDTRVADISTVGAINGLDYGSAANNCWYCIWAISNGSSTSCETLLSADFTTPTLPAGYGFKRRIGAVRRDNAGEFEVFYQNNDLVTVKNRVILDGSVSVVPSVYTLLPQGLVNAAIPPNAIGIQGTLGSFGNTAVGSGFQMFVSANANQVGEQTLTFNMSISGGGTANNYSIKSSYALGLNSSNGQDPRQIYWRGDADISKYLSINGYTLDL